jgi:hypothetical protein
VFRLTLGVSVSRCDVRNNGRIFVRLNEYYAIGGRPILPIFNYLSYHTSVVQTYEVEATLTPFDTVPKCCVVINIEICMWPVLRPQESSSFSVVFG